MNIAKPDQHLASYIVKKQMEPETKIVWRQYRRDIVEAIDHIVELAHGERDIVSSESDWKILEELLNFYAGMWPNEFIEFKNSIPDIRSSRRDKGYSQSKEIKYVAAIPPRLSKLVKSIFPEQQWDKKFIYKFIRKFSLFKVS